MMIDTHCHIYNQYYDDISKLIDMIKLSGVSKIIVNGCDMSSNIEILSLVKKYDIVYGALGFHPTEDLDDLEEAIMFLKKHINDDKIVAVGEIGLDYHYEDTNKKKQIELFERQLKLASSVNKPVIVHSRDAIQDTYDMLSKFNLKGSIHAYSGSVEMANEFVKRGFLIGIGGVCTFKNAKNIIDVIEKLDLSYILLETDSPYLSPVPFRGQVNTPCNIPIIAKRIGEIKGISVSEVAAATTSNANQLFDF